MNLVEVSHVQGRIPITILHLQDRVNLGNISELEQVARQEIDSGARDMLIDLSKTPSITSAGIRVILVIHKMLGAAAMDKSSHLKLVGLSPYVEQVLNVAGLLDYLKVYKTLDDALASF